MGSSHFAGLGVAMWGLSLAVSKEIIHAGFVLFTASSFHFLVALCMVEDSDMKAYTSPSLATTIR